MDWKLVPEEPTKDMIDAACYDYADGNKHGPRVTKLWGSEAASIWRAMFAAAPSKPELSE
jgi:hypothetical protein